MGGHLAGGVHGQATEGLDGGRVPASLLLPPGALTIVQDYQHHLAISMWSVKCLPKARPSVAGLGLRQGDSWVVSRELSRGVSTLWLQLLVTMT